MAGAAIWKLRLRSCVAVLRTARSVATLRRHGQKVACVEQTCWAGASDTAESEERNLI